MPDSLISSVRTFAQENYLKITIALTIAAVFYFVFFLSTYSLRKLKTAIFSSYPFTLFFPEAGVWSIGYFLLAILAFAVLIYLMLQSKFYAGPA